MPNFKSVLQSIEMIFEAQNLSEKVVGNSKDFYEMFDAVLVKKLAESNTLAVDRSDRSTNQTHIALTSKEMDIFPYLHNYNYLDHPDTTAALVNDEENVESFKRRFILQIPLVLFQNNINYLEGEELSNETSTIESYTTLARSRRGDNSQQLEISYKNEDDDKFIQFRELLKEDDYIIFLKFKKKLNYLVLGMKNSDVEEYDLSRYRGLSVSPKTNATRVKFTDTSSFKDENYFDSPKINGILKLLNKNPNIILYGPPGTGKTYYTNLLKNHFDKCEMVTFHQSYSYEQFIEGITAEVDQDSEKLQYFVKNGIFRNLCEEAHDNPDKKYGIIIDEINRGNISKIFGELITLIEKSKRSKAEQETTVKLPYSNDRFSVPKNLYIIGTMNTSDRSIALIDIALRRRFTFYEIRPNFDLIDETNENIQLSIEAIKVINKKIIETIDRDHVIGHTYFFRLMQVPESEIVEEIKYIWIYQILPLLQEYYFANPSDILPYIEGLVDYEYQSFSFSIKYDIADNKFINSLKDTASKG